MKEIRPEDTRLVQFVKKVCQTLEVFALANEEGFAVSEAHEAKNAAGLPISVMAFWSTKEGAEECTKEEWQGFDIKKISLTHFIEHFCVELYEEDTLVGVDINKDLMGYEAHPLVVVLQIIEQLKNMQIPLPLYHFESLTDFETEIKQALDS